MIPFELAFKRDSCFSPCAAFRRLVVTSKTNSIHKRSFTTTERRHTLFGHSSLPPFPTHTHTHARTHAHTHTKKKKKKKQKKKKKKMDLTRTDIATDYKNQCHCADAFGH